MPDLNTPKAGPLAIFDSGVGGLTVVRELLAQLPHEQMVYFGDTARVPYGNKSQEVVERYALEIIDFLASFHPRLLVVACNTVSALAIDKLREHSQIPLVDVIEPAVEAAAAVTKGRVAVLGTKATIRSEVYQTQLRAKIPDVEITSIACPLWVPLVEERLHSHPAARLIIEEYLLPLRMKKVDTVILGCTHYPLLKEAILEFLGQEVVLINSAKACAKKVQEVLSTFHEPHGKKFLFSDKVPIKYFVSDDPEAFKRFGEQFLGIPLALVEKRLPF